MNSVGSSFRLLQTTNGSITDIHAILDENPWAMTDQSNCCGASQSWNSGLPESSFLHWKVVLGKA